MRSDSVDALTATPGVAVQVSTGTARLGELVTLQVEVRHPLAVQVDSPTWPQNSTFEVFASTALPAQADASAVVDRYEMALQNFTTGPQLIPPLTLNYRDPLGHAHTVKSATMTVTIQDVPPDPKSNGDIRGIHGVIGPVGWSPWWWLLAVFILVSLGTWLWKTRKRQIEGPPPPPPEPADVRALRRLQELMATGWVEAGKIKEFYSGISDIVRGYLEDAFKTPALERTTVEILRQLRKRTELTSVAQAEVQQLLESCDLVKFAKFRPEADEALKDHASAVKLVEATRRPERSIQEAAPIPDSR